MSLNLLYRAFGFRQYPCLRTASTCNRIPSTALDRVANPRRHPPRSRSAANPSSCTCPYPDSAAGSVATPFRYFTRALERYTLSLLSHKTIQAADHSASAGIESRSFSNGAFVVYSALTPQPSSFRSLSGAASLSALNQSASKSILRRWAMATFDVSARIASAIATSPWQCGRC